MGEVSSGKDAICNVEVVLHRVLAVKAESPRGEAAGGDSQLPNHFLGLIEIHLMETKRHVGEGEAQGHNCKNTETGGQSRASLSHYFEQT